MKRLAPPVLLLLFLLLAPRPGFGAESPGPQLPAPPCVWTAAYEYKREPARPEDPEQARIFDRMQLVLPRPKVRTVWMADGMRREAMLWMAGKTTERWISGSFEIFAKPNFPDGQVAYKELEPARAEPDFPELAWIRPALLAGRASYQGTEALHYVSTAKGGRKKGADAAPEGGEGEAAAPASEAWIDAETGFPLYFENEALRVRYELQRRAPTAAEMTMPPAYAALWERMRKAGVRNAEGAAIPPPADP
ncbi:MAG TPA: hypothetical protein VIM58_12625 [Candidatus Methylacidiphilales bacterium]